MSAHPWQLVAPWYRTDPVGSGGINRRRPPIFQKYSGTDFANRMVREPQESLKFTNEDFVTRLGIDPDAVVTPAIRRSHPGEPIKLFLDLHSRFYAVVAELHCDMPGFPNAGRDEVCESGFVVRRRVPVVPPEAEAAVARNRMVRRRLLNQVLKTGAAAAEEAAPQTLSDLMQAKTKSFGDKARAAKLEELSARIEANAKELAALSAEHDLSLRLEGWVPGESETGVGHWEPVDDEPEEVGEVAFPMYPLIADPTATNHSAKGRALWFGIVPTGSRDVDPAGAPRFSDNVLYEIRCFVRRHKPHCPKKANETDCCGEIIWSLPTEPYQIASPYDLDGGSHRPINMAMPDLNALRDQAALGPPGRGVNARLTTPPGSGLNLTTAGSATGLNMPPAGGLGGAGQEVCFYFFLIFFIVAYFLFQLFLPIVMFILQLWFLLTLRLCIPPSIGFDAGLAADLKLEGELGAKLDAGIAVEFDAGVYTDRASLKTAIADRLASGIQLDPTLASAFAGRMAGDADLDLDELADIFIAMSADFDQPPGQPDLAADPPTPERGLVYFQKVFPS